MLHDWRMTGVLVSIQREVCLAAAAACLAFVHKQDRWSARSDRQCSTRLTAAGPQIKDELLELLAAACILIASRQGEVSVHMPSEADFQKVTGYTVRFCSGAILRLVG